MQVEIGTIVEGTVTGLTTFGAFVKLPTGETGMVHISEVSNAYVKDIKEHLTENQTVTVKVLGENDKGKISLSIKQAMPEQPPQHTQPRQPRPAQGGGGQSAGGFRDGQGKPQHRRGSSKPNVWQGNDSAQSGGSMSFEDMMSSFKKASDEKISALKRSSDSRYSNPTNRRSGK